MSKQLQFYTALSKHISGELSTGCCLLYRSILGGNKIQKQAKIFTFLIKSGKTKTFQNKETVTIFSDIK